MKLRGIIHNHSECSKEGCYPLETLYKRWSSNLNFAAMTEHAERTTAEAYASYVQSCDELSNEHFRFIPGLEVATDSGDMLLLGCRKFICTTDPFKVLTEAGECVILLAHPEEGHIIPAVLQQVDGFEGWNSGHMGGYMPPLVWFSNWKRRFPAGKIMTGGNDIHKVDPKRKILTIVESRSSTEAGILAAIQQGNFNTTNGIFSFTPDGKVFLTKGESNQGSQITSRKTFAFLAMCYRGMWRAFNGCIELGANILAFLGIDKKKRTSLNRLIRQHL
jgi:hypothetical protein